MEKIIYFYNKIPRIIRNRYTITLSIFVIWICFFDNHRISSQLELNTKLYEMRLEKMQFEGEITKIKGELDNLLNDSESLEKFAREHYYMKRKNEDVFVIVNEKGEVAKP